MCYGEPECWNIPEILLPLFTTFTCYFQQPPPISAVELELEREREKCIINNCHAKSGNHRCDKECNTFTCNFDGNDCSLGINPWKNCTAPIDCWEVFMNGRCDEMCNNPQCLFDGRDCEKSLQPCK